MKVETKVLAELNEDGYSSGQAISEKLSITRSAVWKHIVKLREQGYVIEASPRHGYRLAGRPDKLLPAEIKPRLKARVIGSRIVHLEQTGSTADEARRLIESGVTEGTVVIAEKQTAGRGRLGRVWKTPAGQSIAVSVVLYPRLSPTQIPLLSLATGIAVSRAVEAVCGHGLELAIKWPNDVYLGGKKLAGVLVEMAAELDRVKWVIDSVGINVNNSFERTALAQKATSLAAELGRKVSRRDLLVALLDELDAIYSRARTAPGLESVREAFERVDMLQGRQVTVETPEGSIHGIAMGIDAEGRLLVRKSEGQVQSIFSGEATISGSGNFL